MSIIERIARCEKVAPEKLTRGIQKGTIVALKNKIRSLKTPCAIGEGMRTKVNANIGTSEDFSSIDFELKKLNAAESSGADTIMDLSTSGDLKRVRRKILEKSKIPLGTVPVYETAILGAKKYGSIKAIPESFFIKTIEGQAKEGVDFFTIHSGVTRQTIKSLKESKRVMGIVSRGGAILTEWILENSKENPLYKFFDEIIDIAKAYHVCLSLGDGMRPGAIVDATDTAQLDELITLGRLRKIALKKGVQTIIEGPGHVPLNQIKTNIELEKSICNGAPFYVLGPIVTDIAPGYDHITGAVGGALAAAYGADFLCYVTAAEHLRLPAVEDVREGVIASKIAAHAADIAKNIPGAIDRDIAISKARAARNWEKQFKLALDPKRCELYRKNSTPAAKDVCTMCSDYCAIKISERYLKSGASVEKHKKHKRL